MDIGWALSRSDRLTMPRIADDSLTTPEFQRVVQQMREGQKPLNRSRDRMGHVLETIGYLISTHARVIGRGGISSVERRMLTSLLISQVWFHFQNNYKEKNRTKMSWLFLSEVALSSCEDCHRLGPTHLISNVNQIIDI
jgi:hypothetical protein